ncbi:MAG TPA: hypothetical protein VK327_01360 [Candidatus Paceibacterota bacterium]|nr:hypothetical protein [Candidatus Paceibacterota bacterium]
MYYRRHIFRYGLMVLLGAIARGLEAAQAGAPQILRWEWGETYLQNEFQFEREEQSVGSPRTVFTRTQTTLDPAVGLGANGSVYHPNLMQFHLNTELGPSWKDTQADPGGSASTVKFLQRYHGAMDFLSMKPYASSIFADKDMTYRDYDFFSRVRVDTDNYGARSGYTAGPVPFTVSVQHFDETEHNDIRPRDFKQDTVSFNAQNRRPVFDASTRLSYNLNDFTRHDDGFNTTHGISHSLNLIDNEQFGARKQIALTSLLNYSALTETLLPTDQLLMQEEVRIQHTTKLESFYGYLFSASSAGDSDSKTHDGHAGLICQLRPDLSAGMDARGTITRSTSPGSLLETKDYGAGVSGQYTPTLSSWARLTVGEGVRWDHEDRDASGITQSIINETHALTDGSVTLLTQPNVDVTTIAVWGDSAHTVSYFEGVDYRVIPRGTFTEIQRIPGGTIPNGATVYVDYSAQLQNSASYDTFANTASFRLDFWNGLLGLYGRWVVQSYEGGGNLVLRTLDDKTIGVDTTWRWFHASAEYETVDSNLTPYDRTRFTQSAHFQPGNDTDLSVNIDEGWTDFRDSHIRQTSYGFITRLQQRLTPRLTGGIEGGVRIERGDTFDRDLGTARLWMDYAIGKLSVKATYELNDESHRSDSQIRHYVFMRVRRDF